MKITRHIRYIDSNLICHRSERSFDPPLDIEFSLGRPDPEFYPPDLPMDDFEEIPPIVNAGGVLAVDEPMQTGEMLTVEIRPEHRLNGIIYDEVHHCDLMVHTANGLLYRFVIGRTGVFSLKGNLIEDSDAYYERISSDITDLAVREYLLRQSLANLEQVDVKAKSFPDVMDTRQAADFLGMAPSTLYKKAQSGEIKRNRNKKYLKRDLEQYRDEPERRRY